VNGVKPVIWPRWTRKIASYTQVSGVGVSQVTVRGK